MAATAVGLADTASLIGFGNSTSSISLIGNTINLGGVSNFSFTVPRNGIITAVAANFSATTGTALLGTATIRAQLYISTSPSSNIFTAIPSTLVTLNPTITFPISLLQNASGIVTGLNVPVNAGDRLLMVFSVTTSGLSIASSITGYASAGVSIS
ncbi:exosporium glycoprotein BclB-related protein [Geobacillus thermoleovorans]|uniref:exosporium glycoprotein BclB-related protein n=1 Tax=Geobacillus thermoleovorans TaxID=33941 RepID=UPI002989A0C6|nr:exosporium glycoprotein BclB-related protein [Geobacillus thermoleovorans]